jgi:hypothetical protein
MLAHWLTGGKFKGVDARVFALDGRWCWGNHENLATERELLSVIRKLPMADCGWLPVGNGDNWWEERLAADRHPVAILKADLTWDQQEKLRRDMGESVQFYVDFRHSVVALKAGELMELLRAGKRLLFLDKIEPKSDRPWLDELSKFGVPELRERCEETLESAQVHGLNVTFVAGEAVPVFAAEYSHRPHFRMLVPQDAFVAATDEVRKRRARRVARPSAEVKRLCLVPTWAALRPGLMAQFGHNHGDILATETLKILKVDQAGLLVERPTGLHARVAREQWSALTFYEAVELGLMPGDRIWLTRNNGTKPQTTGLRGGRTFVVRSVAADGTVKLNGRRTLPPELGHWDFAFCQTIEEGPPPGSCRVVCDVADLPLLARHGWLKRKAKIVLCAATKEQAEHALQLALKGRREHYLPRTAEIGDALAVEFSRALKTTEQRPEPVAPSVVRGRASVSVGGTDAPPPEPRTQGKEMEI